MRYTDEQRLAEIASLMREAEMGNDVLKMLDQNLLDIQRRRNKREATIQKLIDRADELVSSNAVKSMGMYRKMCKLIDRVQNRFDRLTIEA